MVVFEVANVIYYANLGQASSIFSWVSRTTRLFLYIMYIMFIQLITTHIFATFTYFRVSKKVGYSKELLYIASNMRPN